MLPIEVLKHTAAPRALALVAAVTIAIGTSWMSVGMTGADALAARSIHFDETGHLHKISKNGASFTERGHAVGTYEGDLTLYLTTTSNGVTFSIAGEPPGGRLLGHGSATISTKGKVGAVDGGAVFTGGTGHFSAAHGTGFKVTGSFNRETYALVVTLAGDLSY